MRILLVHSFYSSGQISGENTVVEQQHAALTKAGHDVRLAAQRTDDRRKHGEAIYRAEVAFTTSTGFGRTPLSMIKGWRPDVVHVHNLFPNFGRRWARRVDVPLVATAHNFRPLCVAATMYRDGHVCFECPEQRSTRPAIEHRCYRNSAVATIPAALGTRFAGDPLLASADRLIVLSETMRQLYQRFGVPGEKLHVVPNFLPDTTSDGAVHPADARQHWLYVGRLSEEKGIDRLIAEWPSGQPLIVVGDGPLKESLERTAPVDVTFMGNIEPRSVRLLMLNARGLIFPSRWFEGLPLVYLESISTGTPVVAWRPSVVADLVAADGTGTVVEGPLTAALDRVIAHFSTMSGRCREVFTERHTEATWLSATLDLYTSVMR